MIDLLREHSAQVIPLVFVALLFFFAVIAVDVIIALHTIAPKRYHATDKGGNLSYSPTTLGMTDMSSIIMFYISKYVPWPLGLRKELKPDGSKHGIHLPAIKLTAPLRPDGEDFRAYRHALVAVQNPSDVNELYQTPLLLVALTTPLLLILLAHPDSPIRPFGAVNVRNRFEFHDVALLCDPPALLRASAAHELSAVAELRPEGVRKRRGMEFTVRVSVLKGGTVLLVQDMVFLQFLPKSQKPLHVEEDEGKVDEEVKEGDALQVLVHTTIPLTTRSPSLWAKCCKDYNPIHVSPMLARLFGFKSSIAHGNHAVALALQTLDNGLLEEKKPCFLEVSFRKPMLLPVELDVQWKQGKDQHWELTLSSGGKVNVDGKLGRIL